jgi:hypothetical protein
VKFKDPEKQIALGLLDPSTCTTRIDTITKRGDQLLAPAGLGVQVRQRVNGIAWNNWATDYAITQPGGWFVIGNEYPLVQTKGRSQTVTSVFYVPYSPQLNTPSIRAAGKEFLSARAQSAFDRAASLGIRSRAYPDRLVTKVPALQPDYIARKLPIEHIDLTEFLADPNAANDREHVLIGVNREMVGSYTCSPAAACGAMQWTKGTYDLIRKTYPAAKLIADFTTGARDLDNAMLAALLLDDYNLAQLKKMLPAAQFAALIANPRMTEEVLDSMYNSGATRPVAVLKTFFAKPAKYTDWAEVRGSTSKAHLLAETKGYIAKLRYLIDEYQPSLATR